MLPLKMIENNIISGVIRDSNPGYDYLLFSESSEKTSQIGPSNDSSRKVARQRPRQLDIKLVRG